MQNIGKFAGKGDPQYAFCDAVALAILVGV